MQHGSTGSTGPLGCRRGAKMGSAPARATHAGLGRWADKTSLQITKEGGDSAKRRVTGDRSQIITARRTARKGEADEGAYEESAASGAAALRMIGSTDGYGQERDNGREAAEKVMGKVPKREKKNESQSEKRMTSRRSTADRVTPTSVRKSGAQPVLAWIV